MFTEKGEVLAIKGDEITVACAKKKTCSCCRYAAMCSADGRENFLVVNTEKINIAKGDYVYVGINEFKQFFGICLIFLFPLIIFVGMLVVFKGLEPFKNFLVAFLGISIYYFVVKCFLLKGDKYFALKIMKVIKGNNSC